jgi:hypothetical protein
MKIRSLLLGSAALAGLSTAGYAADLGVVTSLDVCDELGLSGLTISSDDNCLVITGKVSFEYDWGDYDPGFVYFGSPNNTTNNYKVLNPLGVQDSNHGDVDAWLKFVGTADSDFGPATATIKLISENNTGTKDWSVGIDEAWVGIGDTTMLMAGYKGSIFNTGDDVPLNYLGLFNSSSVNTGVGFYTAKADTGGDVIQVVSNLGNGVQIGGGLEALGSKFGMLTGVGVLSYAGDGVTAHVSAAIGPDQPGVVPGWGWKVHAGFTGAWDPIKVVGAVSADDSGYWDALGSVAATFDMFTLAASAEAIAGGGWGVGGSAKATVSDGVTINLGGRFFHSTGAWGDGGAAYDVYQVEAGVSAAVTETLTLTGAVGATNSTRPATSHGLVFYGSGGLAWAPGGGFTSGASLTVNSLGGYKAVFTAAKDIK